MTEPETLRKPIYTEPPSGVYKISETLVPQMASDLSFVGKGLIDQRKLAVLESSQEQVALMHFNYRAVVDGNRYFAYLVDFILNSSPSLEHGLGRRQVIQTIAAASGVSTVQYAEKPGWVGRHLTQRDWKEKARKDGKIVEE